MKTYSDKIATNTHFTSHIVSMKISFRSFIVPCIVLIFLCFSFFYSRPRFCFIPFSWMMNATEWWVSVWMCVGGRKNHRTSNELSISTVNLFMSLKIFLHHFIHFCCLFTEVFYFLLLSLNNTAFCLCSMKEKHLISV